MLQKMSGWTSECLKLTTCMNLYDMLHAQRVHCQCGTGTANQFLGSPFPFEPSSVVWVLLTIGIKLQHSLGRLAPQVTH